MKVIDNFLEQDKFNFFKKEVTSDYFPWYFNDKKVWKTTNHPDNFQFVNIFNKDNTALPLLDVFKDKLNVTNFIRAKFKIVPREQVIYLNLNYTMI